MVCASHSGEEFHQDAVRELLAGVGLDETALQTPAGWPLDDAAREAAIRAGGEPTPLAMNCSGKHAGMIVTSVINGWPVETYRDPDHPTQLAILRAIDDLTGEQARNLAMDGCGAPLYAVSLAALARSYGRLALASDGPELAVKTAMLDAPGVRVGNAPRRARPAPRDPWAGGQGGRRGVYAVGLPDGRGIALKISDGSPTRPRRRDGRGPAAARIRPSDPDGQASAPVLGHGERVGQVRPALETLLRLG